MVVFLGKGSLCGGGYWVFAQAALKGGKWVEGASGTQHLSPVLGGGAGYRVLPWSDPMIRVVGL